MKEYEVIKRVRAMLQASRTGAPSEKTVVGYLQKAQRIVRLAREKGASDIETLISVAKNTQSGSTWFSRRAALLSSFRLMMEKSLLDQDRLQREFKAEQIPIEDPRWDEWRSLIARMEKAADKHDRLQREPGPPIEERRPRQSKRKHMRGLPAEWRERMVSRLPNYRQAVLVQAVTGCRPDELVRGVRVSIVEGHLMVEIEGAKVTEKSGQPWRKLTWPADSESPLVAMLVDEVRGGLRMAQIRDAKAYSGAVRAAGEREWPKRLHKMAPYCFRHAAASDMKFMGMGDLEISAALGHCADVAKTYYGQWQMGSGKGVAPQSVAAARPVRETKSKPMPSRDRMRMSTRKIKLGS